MKSMAYKTKKAKDREEKTYYFKIQGKIHAVDEDEAREQVYNMANTSNADIAESTVEEAEN